MNIFAQFLVFHYHFSLFLTLFNNFFGAGSDRSVTIRPEMLMMFFKYRVHYPAATAHVCIAQYSPHVRELRRYTNENTGSYFLIWASKIF